MAKRIGSRATVIASLPADLASELLALAAASGFGIGAAIEFALRSSGWWPRAPIEPAADENTSAPPEAGVS